MTARPAECPLFGASRDLPTDRLPTYSDVMRYYKIVSDRIKLQTNSNKDPDTTDVINQIRAELMLLWHKARLFHSKPDYIYTKLKRFRNDYLSHFKFANDTRAKRNKTLAALNNFRIKSQKLFDISKCKCELPKCKFCSNIDDHDREFLLDQKGLRLDTIKVDRHRDLAWQDKLEQDEIKAALKEKQAKEKEELRENPYVQLDDSSGLSGESMCDESDPNDPLWTDNLESKQNDQNRTDLGDLAELAIRFEHEPLSNGILAAITNVVLVKYNIVTKENTTELVDQSKLGRTKDRIRNETLEEIEQNTESTKDLGYDSKIDKKSLETIEKLIEIGSTILKSYSTQTVSLEHYVLMNQLTRKFLKILTVKHSDSSMKPAEKIANAIVDSLGKDSLSELEALSCDGCNMNTGALGGINRFIEEILNRALQWKVCLLHAIELPLKNMMYQLDGASSSEGGFKGELGKLISNEANPPYKMEIVAFDSIPLVDLPHYQPQVKTRRTGNEDEFVINKDQDHLYRMIVATSKGIVDPKLAHRKIVKPSKCRWFVTASNLLRLYWSATPEMFAKPESFQLLKTLAQFIVQAYGPMAFWIKMKWNFAWGAKHFHQLCVRSQFLLQPEHDHKYLGENIRKKVKATKEGDNQAKGDEDDEEDQRLTPYEVVEATLRRNSFCAHPESITVAMLIDDDFVKVSFDNRLS